MFYPLIQLCLSALVMRSGYFPSCDAFSIQLPRSSVSESVISDTENFNNRPALRQLNHRSPRSIGQAVLQSYRYPIPESSGQRDPSKDSVCRYPGKFAVENACNKFIHCLYGAGNKFQAFVYDCPSGKEFSKKYRLCIDAKFAKCSENEPSPAYAIKKYFRKPIKSGPNTVGKITGHRRTTVKKKQKVTNFAKGINKGTYPPSVTHYKNAGKHGSDENLRLGSTQVAMYTKPTRYSDDFEKAVKPSLPSNYDDYKPTVYNEPLQETSTESPPVSLSDKVGHTSSHPLETVNLTKWHFHNREPELYFAGSMPTASPSPNFQTYSEEPPEWHIKEEPKKYKDPVKPTSSNLDNEPNPYEDHLVENDFHVTPPPYTDHKDAMVSIASTDEKIKVQQSYPGNADGHPEVGKEVIEVAPKYENYIPKSYHQPNLEPYVDRMSSESAPNKISEQSKGKDHYEVTGAYREPNKGTVVMDYNLPPYHEDKPMPYKDTAHHDNNAANSTYDRIPEVYNDHVYTDKVIDQQMAKNYEGLQPTPYVDQPNTDSTYNETQGESKLPSYEESPEPYVEATPGFHHVDLPRPSYSEIISPYSDSNVTNNEEKVDNLNNSEPNLYHQPVVENLAESTPEPYNDTFTTSDYSNNQYYGTEPPPYQSENNAVNNVPAPYFDRNDAVKFVSTEPAPYNRSEIKAYSENEPKPYESGNEILTVLTSDTKDYEDVKLPPYSIIATEQPYKNQAANFEDHEPSSHANDTIVPYVNSSSRPYDETRNEINFSPETVPTHSPYSHNGPTAYEESIPEHQKVKLSPYNDTISPVDHLKEPKPYDEKKQRTGDPLLDDHEMANNYSKVTPTPYEGKISPYSANEKLHESKLPSYEEPPQPYVEATPESHDVDVATSRYRDQNLSQYADDKPTQSEEKLEKASNSDLPAYHQPTFTNSFEDTPEPYHDSQYANLDSSTKVALEKPANKYHDTEPPSYFGESFTLANEPTPYEDRKHVVNTFLEPASYNRSEPQIYFDAKPYPYESVNEASKFLKPDARDYEDVKPPTYEEKLGDTVLATQRPYTDLVLHYKDTEPGTNENDTNFPDLNSTPKPYDVYGEEESFIPGPVPTHQPYSHNEPTVYAESIAEHQNVELSPYNDTITPVDYLNEPKPYDEQEQKLGDLSLDDQKVVNNYSKTPLTSYEDQIPTHSAYEQHSESKLPSFEESLQPYVEISPESQYVNVSPHYHEETVFPLSDDKLKNYEEKHEALNNSEPPSYHQPIVENAFDSTPEPYRDSQHATVDSLSFKDLQDIPDNEYQGQEPQPYQTKLKTLKNEPLAYFDGKKDANNISGTKPSPYIKPEIKDYSDDRPKPYARVGESKLPLYEESPVPYLDVTPGSQYANVLPHIHDDTAPPYSDNKLTYHAENFDVAYYSSEPPSYHQPILEYGFKGTPEPYAERQNVTVDSMSLKGLQGISVNQDHGKAPQLYLSENLASSNELPVYVGGKEGEHAYNGTEPSAYNKSEIKAYSDDRPKPYEKVGEIKLSSHEESPEPYVEATPGSHYPDDTVSTYADDKLTHYGEDKVEVHNNREPTSYHQPAEENHIESTPEPYNDSRNEYHNPDHGTSRPPFLNENFVLNSDPTPYDDRKEAIDTFSTEPAPYNRSEVKIYPDDRPNPYESSDEASKILKPDAREYKETEPLPYNEKLAVPMIATQQPYLDQPVNYEEREPRVYNNQTIHPYLGSIPKPYDENHFDESISLAAVPTDPPYSHNEPAIYLESITEHQGATMSPYNDTILHEVNMDEPKPYVEQEQHMKDPSLDGYEMAKNYSSITPTPYADQIRTDSHLPPSHYTDDTATTYGDEKLTQYNEEGKVEDLNNNEPPSYHQPVAKNHFEGTPETYLVKAPPAPYVDRINTDSTYNEMQGEKKLPSHEELPPHYVEITSGSQHVDLPLPSYFETASPYLNDNLTHYTEKVETLNNVEPDLYHQPVVENTYGTTPGYYNDTRNKHADNQYHDSEPPFYLDEKTKLNGSTSYFDRIEEDGNVSGTEPTQYNRSQLQRYYDDRPKPYESGKEVSKILKPDARDHDYVKPPPYEEKLADPMIVTEQPYSTDHAQTLNYEDHEPSSYENDTIVPYVNSSPRPYDENRDEINFSPEPVPTHSPYSQNGPTAYEGSIPEHQKVKLSPYNDTISPVDHLKEPKPYDEKKQRTGDPLLDDHEMANNYSNVTPTPYEGKISPYSANEKLHESKMPSYEEPPQPYVEATPESHDVDVATSRYRDQNISQYADDKPAQYEERLDAPDNSDPPLYNQPILENGFEGTLKPYQDDRNDAETLSLKDTPVQQHKISDPTPYAEHSGEYVRTAPVSYIDQGENFTIENSPAPYNDEKETAHAANATEPYPYDSSGIHHSYSDATPKPYKEDIKVQEQLPYLDEGSTLNAPEEPKSYEEIHKSFDDERALPNDAYVHDKQPVAFQDTVQAYNDAEPPRTLEQDPTAYSDTITTVAGFNEGIAPHPQEQPPPYANKVLANYSSDNLDFYNDTVKANPIDNEPSTYVDERPRTAANHTPKPYGEMVNSYAYDDPLSYTDQPPKYNSHDEPKVYYDHINFLGSMEPSNSSATNKTEMNYPANDLSLGITVIDEQGHHHPTYADNVPKSYEDKIKRYNDTVPAGYSDRA